jgi:hypothetical protein
MAGEKPIHSADMPFDVGMGGELPFGLDEPSEAAAQGPRSPQREEPEGIPVGLPALDAEALQGFAAGGAEPAASAEAPASEAEVADEGGEADALDEGDDIDLAEAVAEPPVVEAAEVEALRAQLSALQAAQGGPPGPAWAAVGLGVGLVVGVGLGAWLA